MTWRERERESLKHLSLNILEETMCTIMPHVERTMGRHDVERAVVKIINPLLGQRDSI